MRSGVSRQHSRHIRAFHVADGIHFLLGRHNPARDAFLRHFGFHRRVQPRRSEHVVKGEVFRHVSNGVGEKCLQFLPLLFLRRRLHLLDLPVDVVHGLVNDIRQFLTLGFIGHVRLHPLVLHGLALGVDVITDLADGCPCLFRVSDGIRRDRHRLIRGKLRLEPVADGFKVGLNDCPFYGGQIRDNAELHFAHFFTFSVIIL